jgi:hypothetical protein
MKKPFFAAKTRSRKNGTAGMSKKPAASIRDGALDRHMVRG